MVFPFWHPDVCSYKCPNPHLLGETVYRAASQQGPGKKPLLLLGWDMPVAQLWRQLLRSVHPQSGQDAPKTHRLCLLPWERFREPPSALGSREEITPRDQDPASAPSPERGPQDPEPTPGHWPPSLPARVCCLDAAHPPLASKSPRVTYYLPHRSCRPQGPRSHSTPPSAR